MAFGIYYVNHISLKNVFVPYNFVEISFHRNFSNIEALGISRFKRIAMEPMSHDFQT